jgi:hypothetical protein
MVRGCKGSRRRGAGGRSVTPLIVRTPERSNPHGDEHNVEEEQVIVGDVVSMMRSFQRMSEELINHLDRDEGIVSVPNEGSQCALTGSCSMHRELVKVNFPKFMGAMYDIDVDAWMENMVMFFALHDYTSNMKFYMVVFHMKGSSLLWWKKILPQLNMVIEDVSWELF